MVCHYLCRSLSWSLAVQVFTVILTFQTDRHFFDGSSWPARHPFLFMIIALVMIMFNSKFPRLWQTILGGFLAVSLFWNTETGIYFIWGTLTTIILLSNGKKISTWISISYISLITGLVFLVVSTLSFGSQVYTAQFWQGLLLPITLYSSGFGAAPQNWNPSWGYLYKFILPITALATLIWLYHHSASQ